MVSTEDLDRNKVLKGTRRSSEDDEKSKVVTKPVDPNDPDPNRKLSIGNKMDNNRINRLKGIHPHSPSFLFLVQGCRRLL